MIGVGLSLIIVGLMFVLYGFFSVVRKVHQLAKILPPNLTNEQLRELTRIVLEESDFGKARLNIVEYGLICIGIGLVTVFIVGIICLLVG